MNFKIHIDHTHAAALALLLKCKAYLTDTAGFPHDFTDLGGCKQFLLQSPKIIVIQPHCFPFLSERRKLYKYPCHCATSLYVEYPIK